MNSTDLDWAASNGPNNFGIEFLYWGVNSMISYCRLKKLNQVNIIAQGGRLTTICQTGGLAVLATYATGFWFLERVLSVG